MNSKKIITVLVSIAMMVTFAVPALAFEEEIVSEPELRAEPVYVALHCSHDGSDGPGGQKIAKDLPATAYLDDDGLIVDVELDEPYTCSKCGNSTWIFYSNNGHGLNNIQMSDGSVPLADEDDDDNKNNDDDDKKTEDDDDDDDDDDKKTEDDDDDDDDDKKKDDDDKKKDEDDDDDDIETVTGTGTTNSGTDDTGFDSYVPVLANIVPVVTVVEEIEFSEEAPPLAEAPPVVVESEEIASFEFIDEEVPLSQMPQTGVTSTMLLWIIGLFGSTAILGATGLTVKKASKKN